MGLIKFEIAFDNVLKIYAPGDILSGQLIFILDSPKKCRGVKVKITGEAKTRWKQGKHYIRGHEEYFSTKYFLVGGETEELEMDPGEHRFPFKYRLPEDLPSSYEAKSYYESIRGSIRYTVKGIIDRPWKFDNETKEAFTVISQYDLNKDPAASEPVRIEESKTFGIFSQTPPLTINMSLPVRGYAPGQSIPIKVNIYNQSGIAINDVKLKIEKYLKYLGNPSLTRHVKHNTTVVKFHKGKIESDVASFDQILEVPSIPPSNLGNCNIIKIKYALELEADIDRIFSYNLKISTPILIGTVPLLNSKSLLTPTVFSTNPYLPSAPSLATCSSSEPSPSAPPDYFTAIQSSPTKSLHPPSYKESMFAADNLKEEDDSVHVIGINKQFAPRYPVYNFKSTE